MIKRVKKSRPEQDGGGEAREPATRWQLILRLVRLKERGRVLREMIDLCEESHRGVVTGIEKTDVELKAFVDPRKKPLAKA